MLEAEMERKKIVRKRSAGSKKRKRNWLNARKIIPFFLLLFLLLFSMAAAGYVIFFRAVPSQVSAVFSVVQVRE
ncbi:MAG: hypothetical protein KJ990_03275 [Proteobacteria bacterium]|nr:hypothetical protein [Pseudomonadota bacterium]MBU1649544.1 hypothetical protein [Pseudomonadota bacterium]